MTADINWLLPVMDMVHSLLLISFFFCPVMLTFLSAAEQLLNFAWLCIHAWMGLAFWIWSSGVFKCQTQKGGVEFRPHRKTFDGDYPEKKVKNRSVSYELRLEIT